MYVWRICKRFYIDSSFSGNGGLTSFGRWHHRGHRIVYTSQSLSLAAWEIFVRIKPENPLPSYVAICAEIPKDSPIHEINEDQLPVRWRAAEPPPIILRDVGTAWLTSLTTAIARVHQSSRRANLTIC